MSSLRLWMLWTSFWFGTSLMFTFFTGPMLPPLWASLILQAEFVIYSLCFLILHLFLSWHWSQLVVIICLCVCFSNCYVFRGRKSDKCKILNKCLMDEWINIWINEWLMEEWASSHQQSSFWATVYHHGDPQKSCAMVITLPQHNQRTALSHVPQWGLKLYLQNITNIFLQTFSKRWEGEFPLLI